MTSKHLIQNVTIRLNPFQRQTLLETARSINDAKLKEVIKHGVGYHHAGLLPEIKKMVENTFRAGNLPILVTTSTLAMGVNLPAHLVIVKSTKHYVAGCYMEYSESTLLQMIGRAGRPQFDTSGTAVILTTITEKVGFLNIKFEGNIFFAKNCRLFG